MKLIERRGGFTISLLALIAGFLISLPSEGQTGKSLSQADLKKIDDATQTAMNAALARDFATWAALFLDPDATPQFGLVAEDVEKVNFNLVVRDSDGKVYTVRYEAVNAMLLNEFLKDHKTVQEQGATITRLQKQIEALAEGLQKVSAQLELNKHAPQTVKNTD